MRKIVILLISVMIMVLGSQTAWAGMRCQGKIISAGLTQGQVEKLCGKPTHTYEWTETETRYPPTYSSPLYSGQTRQPHQQLLPQYERPVYISVNYNRWTYDLGPTQFIKYLIFINGILDHTTEGGYGTQ